MDSALIGAYRRADYRVRLSGGGFSSIRVDAPVPRPLRMLIGPHSWAFITAWNPYSRLRVRHTNHAALQALLATLRSLPSVRLIRPALGVGENWREPSFFIVGPTLAQTDALAQQFKQNAYVHGSGDGCARLRLTRDEPPGG